MESKIFLNPGDVVTIKLDIPNKPIMIVVKKETYLFKHSLDRIETNKPTLIGIRCRWFTTSGELLEAIFNTKDIVKINE